MMTHVVFEYRDAAGFCCFVGIGGEPNAWEHFEAAVIGLDEQPLGLNLYLRQRLQDGASHTDISPVIVMTAPSLHEVQMEAMRRTALYGAETLWSEQPLSYRVPRYVNGYRTRENPTVPALPPMGDLVPLSYKPKVHKQTGMFSRVITGYNWQRERGETAYGDSWISLPILQSPTRNKDALKKVRLRPDYWPIKFDYVVSEAAARIQAALQPPANPTTTVQRNHLGIKHNDLIRACELAGFVQDQTGIDNFILNFHSNSVVNRDDYGEVTGVTLAGLSFTGITPVAVPAGDHLAARHVLDKGEDLFRDLPAYELPFLWANLVEGAFLTEAERMLLPHNRMVAPPILDASYEPFDEEKAKARRKPVVPTPVVPNQFKNPADPKLDQALANLKNAMGLP